MSQQKDGENQAPAVWGKQEGRDGDSDAIRDPNTGSTVQATKDQQKRANRATRQGEIVSTGGEIIGGTLSQLIKDCKGQIAGNEKIISTLHEVNKSLEERVDFYQRLLDQIQEQDQE